MLPFLKRHPFGVEAFFERSLVLTFAYPKEILEELLPSCLNVDLHQSKWGFVAMAIVHTKHLRPMGFPKTFGSDFILIGYRIFVRYRTNSGKNLRGLYILKSQTNSPKMELLGNIFTQYRYETSDISIQVLNGQERIISNKSGFEILLNNSNHVPELPACSPFNNWKEARRFAGPLPFTFSYRSSNKEVLIIEGVRSNWMPQPVEVIKYNIPFLETISNVRPAFANAFEIRNVPYYWKKGVTEIWKA